VLYWFLIPSFSILGAAIGRTVAYSSFNLIVLVQGYVILRLQPFQWGLLKPLMAVAASAIAAVGTRMALLDTGTIVSTLVAVAAFSLTYLLALYLLGLNDEDRETLEQIKARFRRTSEPAV